MRVHAPENDIKTSGEDLSLSLCRPPTQRERESNTLTVSLQSGGETLFESESIFPQPELPEFLNDFLAIMSIAATPEVNFFPMRSSVS